MTANLRLGASLTVAAFAAAVGFAHDIGAALFVVAVHCLCCWAWDARNDRYLRHIETQAARVPALEEELRQERAAREAAEARANEAVDRAHDWAAVAIELDPRGVRTS